MRDKSLTGANNGSDGTMDDRLRVLEARVYDVSRDVDDLRVKGLDAVLGLVACGLVNLMATMTGLLWSVDWPFILDVLIRLTVSALGLWFV